MGVSDSDSQDEDAMPNLLLIESPGKLKKLGQILGPNWIIKASMGHVRELANDGEDSLGFDLGPTIECRYQPRDARSKKVLSDLLQAVKKADSVYIATDPDREGETIGWHLQQALRLKNPRRVVYSEITPQAVQAAISHPRTLDANLVAAGRARDCLDKLVGYKGSRHVVWPLNNGAKSMGRVQSATLHLLCVREREIQAFVPQDYWSVWVSYGEGFKAFYRSSPKPQRQSVKDGAEEKGGGKESERVTSQKRADELVAIAQTHRHQVLQIEGKQTNQAPPAPFVTSTLQQAAGSKLHFSPEQTMKVAQALYEKGHITYMRTDSVMLSTPFCESVRHYLQQHDPTNVPQKTVQHRAIKGSQEAHEAIRPTDVNHLPQQLQRELPADEARLYDLIWNRAVASQCASARLRKTRIVTQSGEAYWEARGQVLEFAGYTRYWNNISADSVLPALSPGQPLTLQRAQADQKQTQPPPRYSEPNLVKLMEQKGIGRPSTYAPTIKTLRQREYVQLLQGKLKPTPLGLELDGALEKLLPDLIQPEFTAQMEAALDAIATGKQEWQGYLNGWYQSYFAPALTQAQQQLRSHLLVPEHTDLRKEEKTVSLQSQSSQSQSSQSQSSPSQPVLSQPDLFQSDLFQSAPSPKTPSRSRKSSKSSSTKSSSEKAPGAKSPSEKAPGAKSPSVKLTRTKCPTCGEAMAKIPSHSPKLAANHFLKCSASACGTVMFWNAKAKRY
ncbi:MAG TPA: type I DNA topoisomerase, partial [Trichocoleus sp.]